MTSSLSACAIFFALLASSHALTSSRNQHDDQKVKEYGVRLAVDMLRQLQAAGVPGVHFCTLNLEKSVTRVLEELGLAGNISQPTNKLIAVRAVFVVRHCTCVYPRTGCCGTAGAHHDTTRGGGPRNKGAHIHTSARD